MSKKLIALVGRPNVGKSTLFNRLSGARNIKAIVHKRPGVTRDRKYSDARLGPLEFRIVDTPGFEETKPEEIEASMLKQTIAAITEADITCFLVDNFDGITQMDKSFAKLIRKNARTTVLAVNKCEAKLVHHEEFYSLGFGEPIPISAAHGTGMLALYEALDSALKANVTTDTTSKATKLIKAKPLKVVIAGRPNAGKSTFINAILKENRLITSNKPGTTRESIEVAFEYKGVDFALTDTAGLRKRANVHESLEKLSTSDAINSINYAQTVIVLLDATNALEDQDLRIARYAIEQGRSLVIGVNKYDLVTNKKDYEEELMYRLAKQLPQVKQVPVVFLSAINGYNVLKTLDVVTNVQKLWSCEISTSDLNNWLKYAIESHPLPLDRKLGRRVRMKYITQVNSRPPTFKIFCNLPDAITDQYEKYLINSIRDRFDLDGIPIRIRFAKPHNPYNAQNKSS